MATNLEKLRGLLQELFQLDQADLDFGIYRIMNQKRDEVVRFLDKDLLPQVQSAFKQYKSADKSVLQNELDKLIANITNAGMNPDESPKVKELRQQLEGSAVDVTALENEVFSHLFSFFRRYYSEGDFISLRRYKEGVYAIPYEGEEVKLHWANADQYYVKSSETFRDYTFKVAGDKRVRVHLVAASTEQDNNKAAPGKERRFVLADKPLSEENGELFVRFEYRPFEGKEKQEDLNKQAIEAVLKTPGFEKWSQELARLAPTEKNKSRTVLEKHLDNYTKRNTFDYFIHKDLGGFLRRELDFYIKNEVMHLDDIEHESAPKVEQYLSQIKVIRSIAHKIIQFLEQLENFQKKLWLKKKFVIETNYCITLDRVPEELYPEIAKNDAQREEWVRLFAIDEIKKDLASSGYSVPLTIEFLKENSILPIDTAFFDESFKDRLIASQSNLESVVEGLLIHGENSHALHLITSTYAGRVHTVFIDPPYNTGKDDFIYKDSYQRSSWLSMLHSRLELCRSILNTKATIWITIDDHQVDSLSLLGKSLFGVDCMNPVVIWQHSVQGKGYAGSISVHHNYLVSFNATPEAKIGLLGRTDEHNVNYSNPDDDPRGAWRTGDIRNSLYRPNLIYDVKTPSGKIIAPPENGWRYSKETMQAKIDCGEIVFAADETRMIRKIYLADQEGRVPETLWLGKDVGTSRSANAELKALFGDEIPFDTPKPTELIQQTVHLACPGDGIVLDFFAGSGTTGHAILSQNEKNNGERRFILVEMGHHFDTALLPRLKKVVYSNDWKDGAANQRCNNGRAFKYIRLESYEDALNNLELKRTSQQDLILDDDPDVREQYLLSYMLDVESRGSQSLLNVESFRNPYEYKLRVERNGETQLVNVDLVETFNWLLGLTVKHIDVIPLKKDGPSVRVVEGTAPNGDRVLVLWRNIDQMDNDTLDKWFEKQDYNTREMVYDVFYVNGDNNLENLRRPDQTWKVRLIEEEFQRLMFDVQDV